MRCVICGSAATRRKKYDRHVVFASPKAFARAVLPYLDVLIPDSVPALKRHSRRSRLFGGHVRICSACGYGTMEHPPSDDALQEFYRTAYWGDRPAAVESAVRREEGRRSDPRAVHQVDFVLRHVRCDALERVLEIGAGAAGASLLLRERCRRPDMELCVCEPGRQWDDYYVRRGILKVAAYFPFDAARRFDYVHTSHWLEHVRDLDQTLRDLRKLVRPSGHVFVEVPNTEHDYWELPVRDTPHIHFFTRRSLEAVFAGHGFECIEIGEFGITYGERHRGRPLTPDAYGAREQGFWIRALFRRTG